MIFIHLYYVPSMSGLLYPGALAVDPEFGEGMPQVWIFGILLLLSWSAWGFERGRLAQNADGEGKSE